MSNLKTLLFYEFKRFIKNPLQIFFTIFFPIGWLLISGFIWGDSTTPSSDKYIDYIFPPFIMMVILVLTLTNIPLNISLNKENKITQHFAIIKIKKQEYIFAGFLINALLYILMFFVLLVLAFSIFSLSLNTRIVGLFFISLLIYFSLFYLGIFIGSIFNSFQFTLSFSLIVFYLLLFTSGSTIPSFVAGEWFMYLQKITPAGNGILFMQQIYLNQNISEDIFPLIYTIIFAITIFALSNWKFKFT